MYRRAKLAFIPLGIVVGVVGVTVADPVGTAFTYQGQLKQSGVPLNGTADFRFTLWDAETDGAQIGSSVAVDNVDIVNGLLTVQLDFGASAFGADARWLAIAARSPHDPSDTNPFTPLSPRQAVTAAPVASYALSGPGSGGYWTLNGDHIYNNNRPGYVGVGTPNPQYNLHVYRDGFVGELIPPARLGVQRFLGVIPPGTSLNDWFAIEVGGEVIGPAPGTRLVRESGTSLYFETEDTMNSAIRSTQMILDADGKLGIGTTSPVSMLEIETTEDEHGIRSTVPWIPVWAHRASTTGTWPAVHGECDSEYANGSAIRGIMTSTSPGSSSAGVRGSNRGTGSAGIGVWGSQDGSGYGVYGYTPSGRGVYGSCPDGVGVYGYSANAIAGWFRGAENDGSSAALGVKSGSQVMLIDGNEIDATGGALYLNNNSRFAVVVPVIHITGADLAEKFAVSEEVKPGMVVAIDPKHPGKLCLARGAYNRCVAGVVSGANNLPSGAVLGHLPGNEDAPPIALSGRVWVYCDATEGSIAPGDLLTTADTPGHAMKVTDFNKAQGAIIGKAMTPLASGHGKVLVLVSLQ